ncbi:hypothetical protein Hanom_Chr04g00351221 [Helianthus anomalus]
MDHHIWKIRGDNQYLEPIDMYSDNDRQLLMRVDHGGNIVDNQCREYVDEKVSYIDHFVIRVLNMDVLEDMVKKLGYDDGIVFYIHFKEPYVSLDFGLRTVRCDMDLESLFDNLRQGVKIIDIYCDI